MSNASPMHRQRPHDAAWILGAALALSCLVLPAPTARPASLPAAAAPDQNAAPSQASNNRALALEMAERTRQTIAPPMHLVETKHFLIFSAWKPSNDAALGGLCEQMFQKLAQQFSIPSSDSVWIGKCPLYLFWRPANYARFISEIDRSQEQDPNMAHASGYHASRASFSYVVINGVAAFGVNQEQAKIQFYHVLVHEGTHAFLHRYVSERPLPLWVEEGLADYMAASLVPQSAANRAWLTATRTALHNPEKLRRLLHKNEDLTATEYGLAQSLVRFLVAQDRRQVIQFLQLLKEGRSLEAALESAYHISEGELVRRWAFFWQYRLARRT
jgi:hypothetical protein